MGNQQSGGSNSALLDRTTEAAGDRRRRGRARTTAARRRTAESRFSGCGGTARPGMQSAGDSAQDHHHTYEMMDTAKRIHLMEPSSKKSTRQQTSPTSSNQECPKPRALSNDNPNFEHTLHPWVPRAPASCRGRAGGGHSAPPRPPRPPRTGRNLRTIRRYRYCLIATATVRELPPIGELARADVVPMHRRNGVRPTGAFVGRPEPGVSRSSALRLASACEAAASRASDRYQGTRAPLNQRLGAAAE